MTNNQTFMMKLVLIWKMKIINSIHIISSFYSICGLPLGLHNAST